MEEKSHEEEDQIVTPWEVTAEKGGKIDYDKLIDKSSAARGSISRSLTASPASRADLPTSSSAAADVLDAYERGEKFYLYTGRGPSSEALHLGHLVPFMFTK
ncbi:nucleotidylyl transferase superfamily protein [Striga asiatica]|uniref:Tryptophanyl-tRNA synthetase n=1 Tax=Striga asiatica TaxID=4170 RepID=A0A5A7Q475_STRAF|nr:nucleotidylyl transferase superfamily protein [Striga asiatica]